MPPQRETFRQTASATPAPRAPCSAAVSSIATRAATRSRTARTARSPCTGSSTSSKPAGASASIACTACSTSHAPLASRRSASSGPAAARTAARRPASSPTPTFTLTQPKPAARGRGGLLGGPRAVDGGERRVDRDRGRRIVGDQRGDRLAAGPPAAIPQREVDRGQRRREVVDRPTGVEQLRTVQAAGAGEHRRVAFERRPRALQADAVVGLERRRLAVAGRRRPRRSARRSRARARAARRRRSASGAREAAARAARARASRADAAAGEDPGRVQHAEQQLQRARPRERAVQRRAVAARAHDPDQRPPPAGSPASTARATAVIEPNAHGSGAVTNAPGDHRRVQRSACARARAAPPACACPRAGRSPGRARC